ncbi:hypothetical protein VD0002_g1028 [Verticillium dahliae]|uniref:RRM domain-containing protein n=2 Tax=Verticillium dahliae TaxID=27337 RepID=G2X961_VERDV|nr:uncharacterized protein VDAG_06693 [Verticillium dahliae VdLs.17]KAF3342644.1 hypothetical protein VdG2_09604 [Verticillium dahliae VDG2]KAH6687599.1 hypothetical protein EV126DRAFT_130063 [Verticillium dahliae]EGY15529.1 hypothetical protein VDAG_06693 [Verticillium dahliae VdLs.17]PNH35848.1 hypothetical protein BJF96_g986 [Verticillium dahliae]PNH53648.1 hypothetical protein VD0003_g3777 [Verticillium dahliae]
MAPPLPVGEDRWVDYVAEHSRQANDLEKHVHVIELFKLAVDAEPSSLKIWRAYCDHFWSLYVDCQSGETGWSEEEQHMSRDIFSLNAALSLWQQGYEAIQYRISDSHELWDRWISLERGLLDRTRTAEGVRRITHLYSDRLQIPHVTRDQTAQDFSTFLSTYNKSAWEDTMQAVTAKSQEAKQLVEDREIFESKLRKAARDGADEEYKTLLKEYLDWEISQSKRSSKTMETTGDLCRGLYSRALTGVFTFDEYVWMEYIRFLSTSGTFAQSPYAMLDVIRRAVDHCPWSGALWSRYILSAEEARLPFHDIEQIKHKATSHPDLYKNGMTALLDMYAGWCGFLKRTAMDLNASDEAVDIADMGLQAAIEFVDQAKNRYGDEYRGDPAFRLERIYIQYLTEKKRSPDDARTQWHKLAEKSLYADSYDFWLNYYLWEMMVFASNGKDRSPTPSTAAVGLRVPSVATAVLGRAVKRKTLDWPERVMDVYLQHCNDYELPSTVRNATDSVTELRKETARRRELEAAQAAELYAAQLQQQQAAHAAEEANHQSPSGSKRKRGDEQADEEELPGEGSNKRQRNHGNEADSASTQQSLKRDRENTSVLVTNIPASVTQTKIRQYFKDYGHINSLQTVADKDGESQVVVIEFRSPEEAQSALLRDGKYFGEAQIGVEPGTDLTVFVTNYPPTAGPDYLRNLFKDCGDIISVRMPSLKGNVRRRFSYVTFRTREASTKATQKHGKLLNGEYKLTAMFSDPSRAKKRDGAVDEGRELHVTNLDPVVTEDELREVFSKIGPVQRVSIPRNKGGKGYGTAYIELASKEQANKAVAELNSTKFRTSIMTVALSTPVIYKRAAAVSGERSSASPAPSRDHGGDETMEDANGDSSKSQAREEVAARSIALLDIPDTVNDARVKEIVGKIAGFTGLVLQPSHGGASIEFEDAASAGRAALQLDGYLLDGRKLRTGSVDELRHAKGEMRTDKIVYGGGGAKKDGAKASAGSSKPSFAPSTVRRPVLGKGGAKRGLGFVASKGAAPAKANGAAVSAPPTEKGDAPPKPMKSNAEFKAMFLGGGSISSTTNGKEDEDVKKKE